MLGEIYLLSVWTSPGTEEKVVAVYEYYMEIFYNLSIYILHLYQANLYQSIYKSAYYSI